MADRIPQTPAGVALQAGLSPKRWAKVVAETEVRACMFDEVAAKVAEGAKWKVAVAELDPPLAWPTFMNWKRRYESTLGETWERLLDRRPALPARAPMLPEVVAAAVQMRKHNPEITGPAARQALFALFGPRIEASDTSLKRVWARAGVNLPGGRRPRPAQVVAVVQNTKPTRMADEILVLHGGTGLALIAAAEAEFGAAASMAEEVLKDAKLFAKSVGSFDGALDDSPDRDEHGHFTTAYAARWRKDVPAGETDARWTDDESKALARNLQNLRLLSLSAPMLAELDQAIGAEAQVNRLTVIDSEAGIAAMLLAMHTETQMVFITVLKGQVLAGTKISGEGPWQSYRHHDELRECTALVKGQGVPEEGLEIRGVQMRRLGNDRVPSQEPTTTYVTNGATDLLATQGVADEYLKRWPEQEHIFRKLRNGGGLNRSHGYGGGHVANVTLLPKLEKAQRASQHAEKRLATATAVSDKLERTSKRQFKKSAALRAQVTQQVAAKTKQALAKKQAIERLENMPAEIYERDLGRDNIATCLKVMVVALLETVLQEYFAGLGMELRTFIEQIMLLPVTMRSNPRQCTYEIQANRRQPETMRRLGRAVAEINRRGLRRGKQKLQFVLIGADP